ncbi:MAG: hypothetical protein JSV14_04100 [Deltaproteobacteria bacterium]|nr:MAG: hypothetical protein JSV14_04100 [Deltaproteobacteria bacterium]
MFSTGYSHTVGLEAGPDGNLYLGNTGDGTISRVNSSGVGVTFLSGLEQPRGLSFDDTGDLFFVETASGNISKSTLAGSVTLVATLGPSSGTFIEVDSTGAIYVSNDPTATIYKIDETSITPFASGFAGSSSPPALGPLGLEFDSYGNLFVADGEYLWKIAPTSLAPDVSGYVYFKGSPLVNVEVHLNPKGEPKQRTRTDSSGYYEFENIEDKNFDLKIKAFPE